MLQFSAIVMLPAQGLPGGSGENRDEASFIGCDMLVWVLVHVTCELLLPVAECAALLTKQHCSCRWGAVVVNVEQLDVANVFWS